MKTKNNVQKTILRSFAVLLSFVLISLTVSAQDFWKKLLTNSSFNEIALAMVKTTETNKTLATKNLTEGETNINRVKDEKMDEGTYSWDSILNTMDESDNPLKIEAWMISDNMWNNR